MAFQRRRFRPRRRFRRRYAPGLATRPRMMGRTLARKRAHGVDTRVFWFKENGKISTIATSSQLNYFGTSDLVAVGGPPAFNIIRTLYDQYKLLGMKVKVFPVNPEIDLNPTGVAGARPLRRGNIATWVDQRQEPAPSTVTQISQIIGNNSTRIRNPLKMFSMSLWRPRGKQLWGSTKSLGLHPDPWLGIINMLINDASPIGPAPAVPIQMYFFTVQYKVIFRGRVDD
ncbi:MAG: hypothetical protein [Circoviridae sp.]|nr:MAG: hypothetical protein [Circoviridae sp.]